MSDDNAHARPTDMHETYCTPPVPSRRGVLAAGAGFAGIAMAQLLAAQAEAAGRARRSISSNAPSAMLLTVFC